MNVETALLKEIIFSRLARINLEDLCGLFSFKDKINPLSTDGIEGEKGLLKIVKIA